VFLSKKVLKEKLRKTDFLKLIKLGQNLGIELEGFLSKKG